MCFYKSEIEKEQEIKIAEKDFYVFKGTDNYKCYYNYENFRSNCKDYDYKPNIIQPKIELKIVGYYWDVIHEGYHSYIMSSYNISRAGYYNHTGLFKISKGSKYYINSEKGEIVSDQIQFIGFLNKNKIINFLIRKYQTIHNPSYKNYDYNEEILNCLENEK